MAEETTYSQFKEALPGKILYIKDINRYGLKIENMELIGQIGNIYDKNMVKKIEPHQLVECKFGNRCRNVILEKYCKFYHDPLELVELLKKGIISEAYYEKCTNYQMNFLNIHWLYSTSYDKSTRHIGSKNLLEYDISMLEINGKVEETINKLKGQIMHDILVLKYLVEHSDKNVCTKSM